MSLFRYCRLTVTALSADALDVSPLRGPRLVIPGPTLAKATDGETEVTFMVDPRVLHVGDRVTVTIEQCEE